MGVLPKAWTSFKYHEQQSRLWRCPKRFAAVAAGRGSGKTELAKRRLVRFLPIKKEWSDPRYFYGAPTRPQAKRIAWDALKALTPPEWVRDVSEGELRIETVFGSSLWVVGLDSPERIEGNQWDGGVLDESCDLRPKTFELNVLPALTWRDGWCWRIGVPKRKGPSAPEFRAYHESASAGEMEDAAGFCWPSSDIVDPGKLEYARTHMDPKDYSEQYEARFETAGGQVFYSFSAEYNVRPCSYDRFKPLIIGSDFNVDPMAWVIGHRHDGVMEWIDEIWMRDTNTDETLDVLYRRYDDHRGGFEFYGDATGRARKTSASETDYIKILNHEGFKSKGRTVHYPRSNPDVDSRFSACNAMFCNAAGDRRMFIDPRCKRLIHDLESRAYKPGTRESDDRGDISHASDAMGYPVHHMFKIRLHEPDTPVVIIRR